MAQAGTASYKPLRSLEEAKTDPDGIAVFEGDDGGQIYLVCPAGYINCSDIALQQLLVDLDEIEWLGNDPTMRRIYYESKCKGQPVPGGMGGAQATGGLWIHPSLVQKGLANSIEAVLKGQKDRIGG